MLLDLARSGPQHKHSDTERPETSRPQDDEQPMDDEDQSRTPKRASESSEESPQKRARVHSRSPETVILSPESLKVSRLEYA